MNTDRIYLGHILQALGRIEQFTKDGRDVFMADVKTQDAVLRNMEVIGEAVKQLSDQLRAANPDIPWKRIAGMRDRLIHDYMGVNLELVWETVTQKLPELKLRAAMLAQALDA